MTSEVDRITREIFQLQSLQPHQQLIIADVLKQHDLLVVSPTGSGKSLCYQIPGIILPGTFVIISPLIALMTEQVCHLKKLGIAAECFHSGLDKTTQQSIISQLKDQQLKIFYVSPERVVQSYFLHQLKSILLSGFAIDEAHCILHWGQDFRPGYEQLTQLKKHFPTIPVMALTATATPKQQDEIIEQLQLNAKKHIHSAYKANIDYQVISTEDLRTSLKNILQRHPMQSGIVYCSSRQRVEHIYYYLQKTNIPVTYYHAGLESGQREAQQKQFYQQPDGVMVATMAFGMGVDKKNIRFIIHQDLPGRLDQYVQESGRAGRDGDPATSYILYHPELFFQFNLWRIGKAKTTIQPELIEELRMVAQTVSLNDCFKKTIFYYFEHITIPPCGTCHACLKGINVFNDDALKLLSCIYRMKNHADWDNVVDVLLGVLSPKTKNFHQLSTFGIGCSQGKWYWYHLLCQLFAKNWISLRIDTISKWHITQQGFQFIKDHKTQMHT